MLIKNYTQSGDYDRTLRRRGTIGCALILMGLVGMVCDRLLMPGSGLPDFVRGFYSGAATGIFIFGMVQLLRTHYLLTHPEAQRKARIKETDEREKSISRGAFYFAGMFTFFLSAAALFVLLPIDMGAFFALFAACLVYFAAALCAWFWLSRRG